MTTPAASPRDAAHGDADAPQWARLHLRPGERVIWWGNPSLWGIVPAAFSTLAAAVATYVSFVWVPWQPEGTGSPLGVPALLALVGLGFRFVDRVVKIRFTAYLVTNQRFYAVTSFLTSTVQSLPFSRFSAVSVRQGLFERLIGLWTARISAYGEAGATLEIPAIRDGERLLQESSTGLLRGANPAWLLRGD